MPNTGRKLSGTQADDAAIGTVSWTTPANAGASDDVYTVAAFGAGTLVSHYLKATNFGFTIPSDARIDGIMAEIEHRSSGSFINDGTISLLKAGAVVGDNKAVSTLWGTAADEIVAYGGERDMWGQGWTPANINGSTFGIVISAAKAGASARDASIDAVWITVYYTRPGLVGTTVTIRDGRYPHRARVDITPSALRYGFQLRGAGQAFFSIPTSHPQYQQIGDLMYADKDAPPMVTIETPDGYQQWVGFVTGFSEKVGDPETIVRCKDHMVRLKQGRTGITSANRSQSSGSLMRAVLADMDARGEPPIGIDVRGIGDGPGVYYNQQADTGEAFIRDMEGSTNWEFGLSYLIARDRVETRGKWIDRLGTDLRLETPWQDAVHFVGRNYDVDFEKGYSAATVIPGTGTFFDRSAVQVSVKGRSGSGADGFTRTGRKSFGFGGTVTDVRPQLLDQDSARAAAQALLDAPENAVETVSVTLVEKRIDRSRLAIGDIRTIRFTAFDRDLDRIVRIVGLDFGTKGEIGAEVMVLAND